MLISSTMAAPGPCDRCVAGLSLFAFEHYLREIGEPEEKVSDAAQKGEAVLPDPFILLHDEHLVEETVDGVAQREEKLHRPPVVAGFEGAIVLLPDALRRFVEAGGVLVAIKGAAAFCGHEKIDLCRTRSSQAAKPGKASGDVGSPEEVLWRVAGAIAQVVADTEEPLMFGQRPLLPVPVLGDLVLAAPQRRDVRVVARYAEGEQLHLAGLIWPEAAQRLAGSPWLVRETHGRGRIILFAGEPCFRGAWDGLRSVLMNALLMEPGR